MLYMVELRYPREKRDSLTRLFQERGITGHGPGITLKDAWVSKGRHVFALVQADDETSFRQMCTTWAEFGEIDFSRVVTIDQIM